MTKLSTKIWFKENVEILMNHHVERFTWHLAEIMNSIKMLMPLLKNIFGGEVEDDNYQWLYVNYQFEEAN